MVAGALCDMSNQIQEPITDRNLLKSEYMGGSVSDFEREIYMNPTGESWLSNGLGGLWRITINVLGVSL